MLSLIHKCPRLSVILPFYNVEKYIAECLDSVYNQDIPEEDYEVICVDDASSDTSRAIVLKYQKLHSNLILVEHDVNKKLGAARNTGRHVAKGKYLWNVDSDDRIAPNCFGEILDKCEKNDLDVLVFSFSRLNGNSLEARGLEPWLETNYVCNGATFWRQQVLKQQGEISPVWTQVYRKDYLNEHNIWSPEINMGEDVPFTFASILSAKRLMSCNQAYYIYRHNLSSLSAAVRKMPTPESLYENCFYCSRLVFAIIPRINPLEEKIRESLLSSARYILLEYRSIFPRFDQSAKKRFVSLCRKGFLRDRSFAHILSRKQAVRHILFLISGRI